MLTEYDEILCHQTVSTFDVVSNSDRNWTEKVYFSVFDSSGTVTMAAGIGKYPNRNVMDAWAGASVEGKQYSLRASRELHPDVYTPTIGPVSYEVVEPLKKVRMQLGENDYGISFDLEFEGRVPPLAEPPDPSRVNGVLYTEMIRYHQLGGGSGTITVDGKTYEVDKSSWYAYRDHSWGVRSLAGVPPPGRLFYNGNGVPESGLQPFPDPPGIIAMVFFAEFDDCGMFFNYLEDSSGKNPRGMGVNGIDGYVVYPYEDGRPPMPIAGGKVEFDFFPSGTRRMRSGRAHLTLEDGTRKEISMRVAAPLFYLYPVGYVGGFKDWWHGKWMGPSWIDGEVMDITDGSLVDELLQGGSIDMPFEYTCDGKVGYGILQYVAFGELPKYGIKAV